MASGYHSGQHRPGTFASSQEGRLDSTAEGYLGNVPRILSGVGLGNTCIKQISEWEWMEVISINPYDMLYFSLLIQKSVLNHIWVLFTLSPLALSRGLQFCDCLCLKNCVYVYFIREISSWFVTSTDLGQSPCLQCKVLEGKSRGPCLTCWWAEGLPGFAVVLGKMDWS